MERDDRTREKLDVVKDDTHDTLDEAKERVKAGGEKLNRAVQGDDMPLGERIGSHLREAGHNLKADLDKSKRDVRDDAAREEGI